MTAAGLLTIIRLPNVLTAAADIVTGALLAGSGQVNYSSMLTLCLASALLYAGGIVQNDLVDACQDSRERPTRPIPTGRVSKQEAFQLCAFLLCTGVILSFTVNLFSGSLAVILACTICVYNCLVKNKPYTGSLVMGLCRALNLGLGLSVIPGVLVQLAWFCLFPFLHITAVTLFSQGETAGLTKKEVIVPAFLLVFVMLSLIFLAAIPGAWQNMLAAILYIGAMQHVVLRLWNQRSPDAVKMTVRTGILALPLLEASILAAFSLWAGMLGILLLACFSRLLAKKFEMA